MYTPTLQKKYREEIVPALMKEFGYKTIMQVPRLEKIVINQGVGQAIADKRGNNYHLRTKGCSDSFIKGYIKLQTEKEYAYWYNDNTKERKNVRIP